MELTEILSEEGLKIRNRIIEHAKATGNADELAKMLKNPECLDAVNDFCVTLAAFQSQEYRDWLFEKTYNA